MRRSDAQLFRVPVTRMSGDRLHGAGLFEQMCCRGNDSQSCGRRGERTRALVIGHDGLVPLADDEERGREHEGQSNFGEI